MVQQQSFSNRPLNPQTERAIVLGLRSLGALAHLICIAYWLIYLMR